MIINDLKGHILAEIDKNQETLWGISTSLFINPEVAFKEYNACELLTKILNKAGYFIETNIGGLETAFRASLGKKETATVAILAEYDALIGLGHACGHNLIAAAAIGAGLGLAAVILKLNGQVQVIGTPAEEGGGGKIILSKAGIFKDIDAAMMFHPASKNMVLRGSLASAKLMIEFFGKASHAAAAPEEGINALEALLLTFNNVNALRQTLSAKDRIAGIIKHGGEASNIVPAYTSAEFSIRGKSAKRRDLLVEKVIICAQAGAQAIGCQMKYKVTAGYAEIIPNRIMAGLFRSNLESLGRIVVDPDPNERMGSTDMGDLSHLVPSIHPYLAVAPENVAGHTIEFREFCMTNAGMSAMLDAAKALAMTTVDLLCNPENLSRARAELNSELNSA
jgi:amidohydrolase